MEFFDIFIFNNVKSDLKIILFQPNKVVFKIKVLSLWRLYLYRKPWWAEVGQTYIHIRRNCTLWFWLVRTSQTLNCSSKTKQRERLMRCIVYSPHWLWTILLFIVKSAFYILTLAWGFRRCTLKDDISCLLPTWLSAGTGKLKRKHHFIGWQERTNKMKNKSCATNFATQ